MKRWLCAVALLGLSLGGARAARAEVSSAEGPSAAVFGDTEFDAAASKAVTSEIKAVELKCDYEEFSREPPSASEVAACEAALAKVIRRGASAIGPVLAAIDKADTSWDARRRLYDVLARTKDTRLVEPLIRGMARIATRKLDSRSWEMDIIHGALLELTRAPLEEGAPWVSAPQQSQRRQEIGRVVGWRLWLEENRGRSHEELAAARLDEELAHAEDASAERAYRSVVYLLAHDRARGVPAAKKLAARDGFSELGQSELEWRIEQAEDAEARAAKKKAQGAGSAKKVKAPAAEPRPKKPSPPGTSLS